MRRVLLIGLSSVAMMMAACSGGSIGESEGSSNPPAVDETVNLLIEENTETVTRGRLVAGAGEISFWAMKQADLTTLKITVNGKIFDVTIDGSVTMDGHGAVLTEVEKSLLDKLSDKLAERFETETVGTTQIEGLAKFSSFLSEAPYGHVHRRLVNGQELPEGVAALTGNGSVKCIIIGAKSTVTYTGRYASTSNGCLTKPDAASANAAARTDGGGVRVVDGGYEEAGNKGNQVCQVTKVVTNGYDGGKSFCGSGDYSCMGRCGAGCKGIGGGWSEDCLRHDQCSRDMCSSGGAGDSQGCGDEYNASSDDIFSSCSGK